MSFLVSMHLTHITKIIYRVCKRFRDRMLDDRNYVVLWYFGNTTGAMTMQIGLNVLYISKLYIRKKHCIFTMGNIVTTNEMMVATPRQQSSMRYFDLDYENKHGLVLSSLLGEDFARQRHLKMSDLIIEIDDHWENTGSLHGEFSTILPVMSNLILKTATLFSGDPNGIVLHTPQPLQELAPRLLLLDIRGISQPQQIKYIRGMFPLFGNITALIVRMFQLRHICNDSGIHYIRNVVNLHVHIRNRDLDADPFWPLYEWATTTGTINRQLTCLIYNLGSVVTKKCNEFITTRLNQPPKSSVVSAFTLHINGFFEGLWESFANMTPPFEIVSTFWSLFVNNRMTCTELHIKEDNIRKDTVMYIHQMLLPLIKSSQSTNATISLGCMNVSGSESKIQKDLLDFLSVISQWVVSIPRGDEERVAIDLTIMLPQSSRRWNIQQQWWLSGHQNRHLTNNHLDIHIHEIYLPYGLSSDKPAKRSRHEWNHICMADNKHNGCVSCICWRLCGCIVRPHALPIRWDCENYPTMYYMVWCLGLFRHFDILKTFRHVFRRCQRLRMVATPGRLIRQACSNDWNDACRVLTVHSWSMVPIVVICSCWRCQTVTTITETPFGMKTMWRMCCNN